MSPHRRGPIARLAAADLAADRAPPDEGQSSHPPAGTRPPHGGTNPKLSEVRLYRTANHPPLKSKRGLTTHRTFATPA